MNKNKLTITFVIQSIKPFKYYILGQVFVGLFTAFTLSVSPYLLKILINKVETVKTSKVFIEMLPYALIYLLISILTTMSWRFYQWILLKYKPLLKKHLSIKLTDYSLDHSHYFFQNTFSGSFANKIQDVIEGIPELIDLYLDCFLSNIITIIITTYIMWTTDFKFALAIVIWSMLFIAIPLKFSRHARELSHHYSAKRSQFVGLLVDILANVMHVRLFSSKNYELDNLKFSTDQLTVANRAKDSLSLKVLAFQGISYILFQGFCLWLLISGVERRVLTAGDFALILGLGNTINRLLWELSREIRKHSELLGKVEQGLKLIYTPHEIIDKENKENLKISKGEIIFSNVTFHYQSSNLLFDKKSITIQPGQKVGLVGYSGSGKTSFVNLILRLYDIKAGSILIDQQDIREISQESLRKAISFIPQETSLFHRSILENIRYGKIDASDEEVFWAAKKAYADEFISKIAGKYHALVGERGIKLSGGQRQRIAIARAFLKNAPILILDEATSQLDSLTEKLIQDSLWSLMQDKTTLVIAHRLSTLLMMDRILVFNQGKIVQDGTHHGLLSQQGLYKKLWDAQVAGFIPNTPLLNNEIYAY